MSLKRFCFIIMIIGFSFFTSLGFSQTQLEIKEGMQSMPVLAPTQIYIVKGNEDFKNIVGYGTQESEVAMMNLMMVEGSPMEGMKMEKHASSKKTVHSHHSK